MDVSKDEGTSLFEELDNQDCYKELLDVEIVLATDFIFSLIDMAIKNGGMNFNDCLNELEFFIFLDFIEWLTRTRKEENENE